MKKVAYILAALLFSFLACTREEEPVHDRMGSEPVQEDGAPDGSVKVSFTCVMMESSAATKALGEESGLSSMRLAVFGGSGYYKEYVTATLTRQFKAEKTFHDASASPFTKEVDCYEFTAELKLSNTPRTVHFLGNGPKSIKIGKANDILPKLLCNDPEDEFSSETAFWQMIWLPAIEAAVNADGEYLNPQGNVRQHGEDYLISPDTQAYFQDIALIRNWAKISLRNNWKDETPDPDLGENVYGFSNFIPHSFALINYPTQGTFVPYGGKTGFIGPMSQDTQDRHYQLLGFDELYYSEKPERAQQEYPFYYGYKGNLPQGAVFNHDIPTQEDFENGTGGVRLYSRTYDVQEGNTGTQWYDDPGETWRPSASAVDPDLEPSVYLYERPAPSEGIEPSFVLIYGKYKNPKDPSLSDEEKENGVMCYYKIDLMDGRDYYPIFRNFKYQVHLRKITSRGYDNPRSAAESAGSANVSADVTAAHLSDISDGTKRMAIDPWMSYTFIDGDPDTDESGNPITELPTHLYVKFIDDITTDPPSLNENASSVWAELTPSNGSVIVNNEVVIGEPAHNGSEYGWRPIKFKVANPDAYVSKTQTLRIYCQTDPSDPDELPLYRDIVLTLQPKQTMKVSCRDARVVRVTGTEQEVDITIPSGLVASMFPLVFTIEPQEMTLTALPTTTAEGREVSMPVVSGPSINPDYQDPDNPSNVLKPRFQFERTITWDEYNRQRTFIDEYDESRWKTFPCMFKTNCDFSATVIWVANKYFNPAKCAFSDFRSFTNARFTTSIPSSYDKSVTVSFGIGKDLDLETGEYKYPRIYVKMEGLKRGSVTGTFNYQPVDNNPSSRTQEETLTFTTTNDAGNVSVTIYTAEEDGYEPVVLRPWRFTNVGFLNTHALPSNWTNQWGTNSVFDMVNSASGKKLVLGFCTDPANKEPVITYNAVDGNPMNLNVNDNSTYDVKSKNLHSGSYNGRYYSGREDFYWHEIQTSSTTSTSPVWFIMSSPGYVEKEIKASRFTGDIQSKRAVTSDFRNWFSGGTDINSGMVTVSNCYFEIEISDEQGNGPTVGSNGLVLTRGKTYDVKVWLREKKGSTYPLTSVYEISSVQLEYYPLTEGGNSLDVGIPQSHLDYEIMAPVEDDAGSSFYQYMGANYQYIWDFPRHQNYGHLKLRTPNSRDAVIESIRLWGFKDNS